MPNIWNQLVRTNKPFFALAPMDGVTDCPFRELIADIGKPDVLFTEFTNVDALAGQGYSRVINRLAFSKNQHPIIAQIWGKTPENYIKAAKLMSDLGFDGIDINMGCPERSVMKSGAGAQLILNPHLAKEIIQAVKEGARELPVSVKTRLGTDVVVTDSWIPFLLNCGLQALTVHLRTAAELSKSDPHYEELGKIVRYRDKISPNTAIIVNGGIKSLDQGNEVYREYKIDGVMIGEGVFSNPWIFNHKKQEYTAIDHYKLLLKHVDLYSGFYKDNKRFNGLKKFFVIYLKSLPSSSLLKKTLMNTKNASQVKDIVEPLLKSKS